MNNLYDSESVISAADKAELLRLIVRARSILTKYGVMSCKSYTAETLADALRHVECAEDKIKKIRIINEE